MSLVADIKWIQRVLGVQADGVFGPVTAQAVMLEISGKSFVPRDAMPAALDARTLKFLATLDPKAQPRFRDLALLGKATAATYGCDYVMISGNRTWKEQDALHAQPRDGKDNDGDGRIDEADEKVTNARGGQSNHNFGIAADFGVFKDGAYLDAGTVYEQDLAEQIHRAVSIHAHRLGFDWGGDWKNPVDFPHFELRTGLTLAAKRELYQKKGSVL